MTLYPKAQWRPLGPEQPSRMSAHNLVILHTMVGSLAGTDAMFHAGGYGGTESHFGVGYDGTTYQWTDLECRADANLDANSHAISIETADWGEGPFGKWDTGNPALVPAWTDQQVEALAQIVAWCCQRWSIPCELVPDSKPGRRGVGYHRQGIDNWRVAGGEKWSLYTGKVCPGSKRIAQVPEVIKRAQQIMSGDSQDGGDWLDMADIEDVKNALRLVLNEGTGDGQKTWAGTSRATLGTVQAVYNQNAVISGNVDEIEAMVQAAIEGLPPGAGADEIAKAVADEIAKRVAA